MFRRSRLRWCIRVVQVILRSLTLAGAVVCLAGMGILTMMPIRLVIGVPEQTANLLGPALWSFGAAMAGVVLCRMTGTTFSDLLSRYVFGELVPTASDRSGEPQTLFLAIVFGTVCPWFGIELVVVLIGSLGHWSLPEWVGTGARLLVVIGGGIDTVRLVLRRYPKVFSDDPIVRRIYAWRKGRK